MAKINNFFDCLLCNYIQFSSTFFLPYQIYQRNLLWFSMKFEMAGFSFPALDAARYLLIIKVNFVNWTDHQRFITPDTRSSYDELVTLILFCYPVMSLFPLNRLGKNHWRSKLVFKKIQNRVFVGVKKTIWLMSCLVNKMVKWFLWEKKTKLDFSL